MCIPLDQLYNFLDGIIKGRNLIYRFSPHGSKNIEDLSLLKTNSQNWQENLNSLVVIMHDQEPLNFDYYNKKYLTDRIDHWFSTNRPGSTKFLACLEWKDDLVNNNLGMVTNAKTLYDKNIICHSELNSTEVKKYQDIGFETVYWWSHAVIARDWYRYAEFDTNLDKNKMLFEKDFNVYARAWTGTREYRLKFLDLLVSYGLNNSSNVKFSCYENSEFSCFANPGIKYSDYIVQNKNFAPINNIDCFRNNNSSSGASASYDLDDYNNSWFDVVLETIFDDQRIHLTEKILRPIACGKPFILVSTPGGLSYLKNYGFKTFEDIIDESYDQELDPIKRLQSVLATMQAITGQTQEQKKSMQNKIQTIVEHNQKHFFSKEFFNQIVNEFTENYKRAAGICEQYKQGKNYIAWRKMICKHPNLKQFLLNDGTVFNRDDVKSLLESRLSQ